MTEREWLENFSEKLTELLKDTQITQRELADAAGLSESSVSDYIHGRKMPGVKALTNIAYVFDVTFDELMDFEDRIR